MTVKLCPTSVTLWCHCKPSGNLSVTLQLTHLWEISMKQTSEHAQDLKTT